MHEPARPGFDDWGIVGDPGIGRPGRLKKAASPSYACGFEKAPGVSFRAVCARDEGMDLAPAD
jgi:hypothetical protein